MMKKYSDKVYGGIYQDRIKMIKQIKENIICFLKKLSYFLVNYILNTFFHAYYKSNFY